MLIYVHYIRLADSLYNLIYIMQTKLQLRHVRRSQEFRQRTGITYITSYFFLGPKLRRKNLQTQFPLWKRIKYFPSTLRRGNLKTQQSPVIFDLCLKKPRAGKPRDYRDVIVLENFRLKNVFRPHEHEHPALSNSSCFKTVFVTD